MKLNKSKLALCLLAASTASVSLISHAENFDSVSSAQVTMAVAAAGGSSILTLDPAASLPAAGSVIPDGTVVAKAVNDIIGTPMQSGLRFTPTGDQDIDPATGIVTIHTGQSNNLVLAFADQADAAWTDVTGDKYLITNEPVQAQVSNIVLSGAQTVTADTYNLSVDGVIYNK
ncbi:hypothetical protein FS594_02305 [Rahnella aquatilis]|nr:hypothetical protein FS594_02305 [Rahnella aquatilis]